MAVLQGTAAGSSSSVGGATLNVAVQTGERVMMTLLTLVEKWLSTERGVPHSMLAAYIFSASWWEVAFWP